MITQKELRELLDYDSHTGVFKWKVSFQNRVKGDVAGCIDKESGYIKIRLKGKLYRAHRLVWLYVYGKWPNKIDHLNHIRDDNSLFNLREASSTENSRNQSKRKDNTSGYVGVTWNKARKKWKAQIRLKDTVKFLGYFQELEDAIKARKEAESKYKFHENHGKESRA